MFMPAPYFKEGVMPGIGDPEDMKRLLKEALKEWLDEKFTEFGKWSLAAIGAMGLAALTYFILQMNGWHR